MDECHNGEKNKCIRLLGGIQLQAADSNRLPSFHGDSDASSQGRLPGCQEVLLDRLVVSLSCGGNLLHSLSVLCESPTEFVFGTEGVGSGGSGTTQSMGQSLMLSSQRRCWGGCRKVRALKVCGSEGGEIVADCGAKFRDRLLDLCGVVVRLRLIDFGNPGQKWVNEAQPKRARVGSYLRRVRWVLRKASTRASRSLYSTHTPAALVRRALKTVG